MRLTIPLELADAEMVKVLSALESGKMRTPFDSEVIYFNQLNEIYEKSQLPTIPALYLQGTLFIKFGIVFNRQEIGKDLIRYTIDHSLYGNLGVFWFRTVDDIRSDFDYEPPPLPSQEEARKLLENFPKTNPFLFDISDKDLEFGLRTETFEPAGLHLRRKNLQQEILQAYLESIQISLGATINEGWDTSTREFIVNMGIRHAVSEVESFIKHYENVGELAFSRYSLPDDIFHYEIFHHFLGQLGKLSIHFKGRDHTKIQITPPDSPSLKETDDAILNISADLYPSEPYDHIAWLSSERENENRKFFHNLYLHLKHEDHVEVLKSELIGSIAEREGQVKNDDISFTEVEFKMNVSVQIAISEMEKFYKKQGGNRLLPELLCDGDSQGLHFRLKEKSGEFADTIILFSPTPDDRSQMTIANDSYYWGWKFGEEGRSMLGISAYLEGDISPRAKKFCKDLIAHFRYDLGYIKTDEPAIAVAEQTKQDESLEVWERIPDHLWDRNAVQFFCENYTNSEIAKTVGVHPRRITNRISELRKQYPFIPYKEQVRKAIIKKTRDSA